MLQKLELLILPMMVLPNLGSLVNFSMFWFCSHFIWIQFAQTFQALSVKLNWVFRFLQFSIKHMLLGPYQLQTDNWDVLYSLKCFLASYELLTHSKLFLSFSSRYLQVLWCCCRLLNHLSISETAVTPGQLPAPDLWYTGEDRCTLWDIIDMDLNTLRQLSHSLIRNYIMLGKWSWHQAISLTRQAGPAWHQWNEIVAFQVKRRSRIPDKNNSKFLQV